MVKLKPCYQCGCKAKRTSSTIECVNRACRVCVKAKNAIEAINRWNNF